jgi:hypothetical protein
MQERSCSSLPKQYDTTDDDGLLFFGALNDVRSDATHRCWVKKREQTILFDLFVVDVLTGKFRKINNNRYSQSDSRFMMVVCM